MEELFVWCIWDKPDALWIDYEIMWANWELPSKAVLNDQWLQNQSLDEKTKYMCTAFSNTSWANEILSKRMVDKKHKWIELWMYMVTKWLLDIKAWAYIIDACKCAKEQWIINWYTTVKTLNEIKSAIANDRPVMVGSNQINRKETLNAPYIAIRGSSYWHAFFIAWYDDEKKLLICENSYWDKFDNWRFYIKYEDLDILFSGKFAVYIDDTNFNKLNILIKEAKIWWYKDFYDLYIKWKTWEDKMLAMLAYQLVFIKKVNNKELLNLIK